eukprot:4535038-Pleurochrysis_carterae.AAC.1
MAIDATHTIVISGSAVARTGLRAAPPPPHRDVSIGRHRCCHARESAKSKPRYDPELRRATCTWTRITASVRPDREGIKSDIGARSR